MYIDNIMLINKRAVVEVYTLKNGMRVCNLTK